MDQTAERTVRVPGATVIYRDGQPFVGAFYSSASAHWRVSDRRTDEGFGLFDTRVGAEMCAERTARRLDQEERSP